MDNNTPKDVSQPSIYHNSPANTPHQNPVPTESAPPVSNTPPQTPPPPDPKVPSSPPPPIHRSRLPLLIIGFLVVLILGLGAYIVQNISKKTTPEPQVTTPTPTMIPTATPTPMVDESSTSADLNSTRYYDQDLGILFDHAKTVTGSGTQQLPVLTQKIGSRVYVYVTGTTPSTGQYVDVLSKLSTDDVVKAATKIIQQDAKFDTCNIQLAAQSIYPGSYQKADLVCSGPGGGISFFLTNTNHPTKLLYVSIGQYGIPAVTGSTEKMWQDTIHLLSTSNDTPTADASESAL